MLRYIISVLLLSAVIIVLYISKFGAARLGVQLVRFALTVLLCIWVYRGNNVARIITVVLLGIAGLGAAVLFVTQTSGLSASTMMSLALMMTYLSFAWHLLMSEKVADFLAYQRGESSNVPTAHQDEFHS